MFAVYYGANVQSYFKINKNVGETKDGITKIAKKVCGFAQQIVSAQLNIQLHLFTQTLTRTQTLTINKTVLFDMFQRYILYAQLAKISFIISVFTVVFYILEAHIFSCSFEIVLFRGKKIRLIASSLLVLYLLAFYFWFFFSQIERNVRISIVGFLSLTVFFSLSRRSYFM